MCTRASLNTAALDIYVIKVVKGTVTIPHEKRKHITRANILVFNPIKPIEWGERMADMIFLLAINFDSVNTTKAFFHDFTKLLNENGATDRLREAASPHELCAAIRKELGWN